MRAGLLRHRIQLQAPASGQDAFGEPLVGWVNVATVWADIRFESGMQSIKADSPVSVAKASIRIRHRAGVVAHWRALHGTVVFDIKAVLPDRTDKRHLDLSCETGANNG